MFRTSIKCFVLLTLAGGVSRADETLQPIAEYSAMAGPLVEQYCLDCHSGDAPDAGLALHSIESGDGFQRDRAKWKKVLQRLRAGDMPPKDYDSPSDDERTALAHWIETRLEQFDCSVPQDPGWVTLRRLNRDQYRNTIRDLLYVDFQPSKTFPPDDLAYGFDNNADALSLTSGLIDKYLAASRTISRQAMMVPESITDKVFDVPKKTWQGGQYDREDRRDLTSNGAIEFLYEFDKPGRYWLRVSVAATQGGSEPVRMGVLDDSHLVQTVDVRADGDESEQFAFALDVEKGQQRLGVAFLNDWYEEGTGDRNLSVERLEVIGPADELLSAAPRAHQRWFANAPSAEDWRDEKKWKPTVRKPLNKFVSSAYRRPVPAKQLDRLMELVDSRRVAGDTYERAMEIAIEATLVSPRFLFIGNVDEPMQAKAGEQLGYDVDEYELASRLSYFLWSSMPDATLLRLASTKQLRNQLPQQLDRMLRDRRAEQFSKHFTGQWLGTRLLVDLVPDESQFDSFDRPLRTAMAREAEMVMADVVRSNLPITTLLDADFTYLNGRLAEHYGIEGVKGNHFRRVELAELGPLAAMRGGVLTMAGVLAATSNPDRTSPVKRGKWVLGELLAAEPPAPPPGIDSLEEIQKHSAEKLSVREQMARHRADPSCAVCHEQMDAFGLALENYDLVGRWRTEDGVGKVDASSTLPSGEHVEGVEGLKTVLLARSAAFRKCLAEKLLTYALGRGLEYYDECAVREIVRRTRDDGDKMRTLLLAVIESPPFQQRRYDTPAAD
jgi:hypothetical protein